MLNPLKAIVIFALFSYPLLSSRIHDAVIANNVALVKQCIDDGDNINELDELGRTPLSIATDNGFETIARLLRYRGAREVLSECQFLNAHETGLKAATKNFLITKDHLYVSELGKYLQDLGYEIINKFANSKGLAIIIDNTPPYEKGIVCRVRYLVSVLKASKAVSVHRLSWVPFTAVGIHFDEYQALKAKLGAVSPALSAFLCVVENNQLANSEAVMQSLACVAGPKTACLQKQIVNWDDKRKIEHLTQLVHQPHLSISEIESLILHSHEILRTLYRELFRSRTGQFASTRPVSSGIVDQDWISLIKKMNKQGGKGQKRDWLAQILAISEVDVFAPFSCFQRATYVHNNAIQNYDCSKAAFIEAALAFSKNDRGQTRSCVRMHSVFPDFRNQAFHAAEKFINTVLENFVLTNDKLLPLMEIRLCLWLLEEGGQFLDTQFHLARIFSDKNDLDIDGLIADVGAMKSPLAEYLIAFLQNKKP